MAAQGMAEGSQSNSKLPSAVPDASDCVAANQLLNPAYNQGSGIAYVFIYSADCVQASKMIPDVLSKFNYC